MIRAGAALQLQLITDGFLTHSSLVAHLDPGWIPILHFYQLCCILLLVKPNKFNLKNVKINYELMDT